MCPAQEVGPGLQLVDRGHLAVDPDGVFTESHHPVVGVLANITKLQPRRAYGCADRRSDRWQLQSAAL